MNGIVKTPCVTVFVPTYNRIILLSRLYESLLRQTDNNFTLLIIDDGSTDSTKDTVGKWIKYGQIAIRYIYQENSRKHFAYNRAITEVDTELFLEIDSDDYLRDYAIEKIIQRWNATTDTERFCGMQFLCEDSKSKLIGSRFPDGLRFANNFDLRYNHCVTGDKLMVYRSTVLKQHALPAIKDEYVMESILHNRVSRHHPFLLFNEALSVKDYQPTGMSSGTQAYCDEPYPALAIKMNECNHFTLTSKQYMYFTSRYIKYSLLADYPIQRIISDAIRKRPLFWIAFISGVCKWIHTRMKKRYSK